MKTALAAALMFGAAAIAGAAIAQTKPMLEPTVPQPAIGEAHVTSAPPDARQLASDRAVGEARRYYRAQCNQHESAGFCECVTAGVAQALAPVDVRLAGRTIGERITAQGDAPLAAATDQAPAGASQMERIDYAESFYADACQQYRR